MNYRSDWNIPTATKHYHHARGFVPDFETDDYTALWRSIPPHNRTARYDSEGSYHEHIATHGDRLEKDVTEVELYLSALKATLREQFSEAQRVEPYFLAFKDLLQKSVAKVSETAPSGIVTHWLDPYKPPTKATRLSRGLERYFHTVAEVPEFSDGKAIRNAKWLLNRLGEVLSVRSMPTPQVAPSDEGSLAFSWQTDDHQFGLYVYPSNRFDWLWRNRSTKEYEGEEDVELGDVPWRLVVRLKDIFADR